ncbi:MAG TPA: hypothetical protein PKD59_06670 [Miltoncostaeaceae bacterium]|nr:hypothetical protein [Miltoncostaeaceae bacterium]
MFFRVDTVVLWILVFALMLGATALGLLAGRLLRRHSDGLREPIGVVQGALLGFVALILAFGLSLAVGRYETRRAATVDEANAIGTTYLRAQTLLEPQRSASLALLRPYTDATIRLSHEPPGSAGFRRTLAEAGVMQRRLWALAGEALDRSPDASAPRLYVETLNETFDALSTRAAALDNRVPGPVLAVEVGGAAASLFLLALYLAFVGRGTTTVVAAAALVALLLLITFDLDRPVRGLITVPDTPLVAARAEMALPPAAAAPAPP